MEPTFALAYKDLAIIYLSRRFFEQAEENFNKAYKLAPENIYILFEYANYYHLMSEFENAKKMYSKLLKLEDIPSYMKLNVAVNYMSMNLLKQAKEILLDLLKETPQNVEVLFHLAQIYDKEENFENAKQLLEDAYTIAPNTEIANLLAKVSLEIGEYNQAYALYNIVNLVIPNNIGVLFGLAKCKYMQKEFCVAKEHLNSILKIIPEHEEAIELLRKIEEEEK
jgi:tetratricopeptide (TPR) repeat protein